MTTLKVLIVDDEDAVRKLLKSRMDREEITSVACSSAEEAEQQLQSDPAIAVVVTDVKMPGKDGITFMTEQKSLRSEKKFIVMTGNGEKSTAIRSLKSGASDYLEKPFEVDELVHSVKRAFHEYELERHKEETMEILKARAQRAESIATDATWFEPKSFAMNPVVDWMQVLRRESMKIDVPEPTVLILGETGTGKEGIARQIHRQSRRGNGPWVAINCANFSETLLESELFGHERGSFTGANTQKRGLFELASGGTLFLDEVGEMDLKIQSRILRVIQEKTFRRVGGTAECQTDVRVIAATNKNLETEVARGHFREDLFHRLSGVVIDIPALRNRKEDLIPMAEHFIKASFAKRGKKFEGFTSEAIAWLEGYGWPGNVRELLNLMERTALVWNRQGYVDARDLPISRSVGPVPLRAVSTNEVTVSFSGLGGDNFTDMKKQFSDEFERQYLLRTLDRHHGNVTAAAKEAMIDRSNFLRLLRRHGIQAKEYRKVA